MPSSTPIPTQTLDQNPNDDVLLLVNTLVNSNILDSIMQTMHALNKHPDVLPSYHSVIQTLRSEIAEIIQRQRKLCEPFFEQHPEKTEEFETYLQKKAASLIERTHAKEKILFDHFEQSLCDFWKRDRSFLHLSAARKREYAPIFTKLSLSLLFNCQPFFEAYSAMRQTYGHSLFHYFDNDDAKEDEKLQTKHLLELLKQTLITLKMIERDYQIPQSYSFSQTPSPENPCPIRVMLTHFQTSKRKIPFTRRDNIPQAASVTSCRKALALTPS